MSEEIKAVEETTETVAEEALGDGLVAKVTTFGKNNYKVLIVSATGVVVTCVVVKNWKKLIALLKKGWTKFTGLFKGRKADVDEVIDAEVEA